MMSLNNRCLGHFPQMRNARYVSRGPENGIIWGRFSEEGAGDYPTGKVEAHRIRHGTWSSRKVVGEEFGNWFPEREIGEL